MTSETDIRQKKLLDLLRGSIQPLKTEAQPNLNPPPMRPRIMVGDGGISGLPKPDAPPPPNLSALPSEQVERVRVGQSTQGMDATQRQQTYLDLLREASPRSSVVKTPDFIEESAPKPKGHGLLNTLKHLGEGALIGTGEYARTHPGASAGELIGAGGAGAIAGGVKPETIDYVKRQAEIGQAESDLDRQLGEGEKQAQIGVRQAEPVLRAQQIANEAAYHKGQQEIQKQLEQGKIDRAEAQRQIESLKMAEQERHNRETERLGQAKIDKPANRSIEDYGQSAEWNYKKQKEAESTLAGYEAQLKSLPAQTSENYYQVKDQKDRLEKLIDEARGNAQKYRDEGDKAAAKVKTKTSPNGPTPDKPETRKGTISKEQQQLWLSHNPGKTIEDMKKLYPNAVMVN